MADEKVYLYSIAKSKKTGEAHIFRSHYVKNDKGVDVCTTINGESICQELKYADVASWNGTCLDDAKARAAAVVIARGICGTCVSDLYLTKKK